MTGAKIMKGTAIAGIVLASLLAAAAGRAEEPVVPAGISHADVHVRVIHARNGKKHLDAHLDDLKKTLEKYKYDSYSLVIDETLHLPVAGTQSLSVLSGKTLQATLVAVDAEKATIRLVLDARTGKMLDTTVAVGPDKQFFIAGPSYDDGILFLAIEPHYDPNNLPGPAVGKRDDGKKHE